MQRLEVGHDLFEAQALPQGDRHTGCAGQRLAGQRAGDLARRHRPIEHVAAVAEVVERAFGRQDPRKGEAIRHQLARNEVLGDLAAALALVDDELDRRRVGARGRVGPLVHDLGHRVGNEAEAQQVGVCLGHRAEKAAEEWRRGEPDDDHGDGQGREDDAPPSASAAARRRARSIAAATHVVAGRGAVAGALAGTGQRLAARGVGARSAVDASSHQRSRSCVVASARASISA